MKQFIFLFLLCSAGLHAEAQLWQTSFDNADNIYYDAGYVAIGKTRADLHLDISTSGNQQGMQLYHTSGRWARFYAPSLSGGAYNSITVGEDAGIIYGTYVGGVNSVSNGFVIAPHRTSVSGIRITPTGTVGIGTRLTQNTNGYTLAVNGIIGAKEIQVENSSDAWADYVFEDDYNLRPLSEVESFINDNKHLPEIPSAEEVAKQGHKLGQMDVLLLKKVEELTLYMIDQQKQIEELKEQNRQQQEEIQRLKGN